jgi:dTDP-glucose 4,6-dehydratase
LSKINSQILTIVGGSGFIGKSIIDAFNNGLLRKHQIDKINIICRKKFKFRKKKTNLKKVRIIYADISKTSNLPQSDLYIYAAETTDVKDLFKKNLKKAHKKNIQNFIKLVSKYKNSKVLYTSSGAVNYLNKKNFQDPYKIQYTKLKIFSESEIKKLQKFKIKSSIARCYTFIGPHLPFKKHYAIGNFLYGAKYNNKILIRKKLKVIRSYMYADDMVEWLILILLNSKMKTVTYNVGSDQPIELSDLAHKVAKLFKRKIHISKVKQETNKIDKYVPNISKTKSDLKIKILYNLSRSLKKCLKFV